LSGVWLASYLLLWALVLILGLVVLGLLRQLGMLSATLRQRPEEDRAPEASMPALEHDGPPIGSGLPELVAETCNRYGSVVLTREGWRREGRTLLVFLSPLCESCHRVVEPLNLVPESAPDVQPIVFLRADHDGCSAFLRVFPLQVPVICDERRDLTMGLAVHRNPFGLLYDRQGVLIRKGIIAGHEDLQALLGNPSAPEAAWAHVYPGPASPAVPA
jgi:hypothetical protein